MAYFREFLIGNPLIELGLVALVLVVMGLIMKALKQPVIIGYILGGLLLGPQVFDVIHHYENIEFYAHFGVALLLFMVGLGLNPSIIKEVGKVAAIAGIGQVLFTSLIGFLISLLLGFSVLVSIFIAVALTFSSTIIIVKLISDRGDSGTKYGKIALGILIVQDIIAMLILMGISASTMDMGDMTNTVFILRLLASVIGLLLFSWVVGKYALPPIMKTLSYEKELMLLFVITWSIVLGGMWYFFGFSMEIGALLAGVTLAHSRYRFHIFSELRPFRDFFLALFFVYLGGQIVFDSVSTMLIPLIVFSAFVLFGNPCIITFLMMKMGHNRRDSFMTGLTVAQISEFSFIMIGLALTSGILNDPDILSLVTIIGLITMTGSSYMFAHADSLFSKVSGFLARFEHESHKKTTDTDPHDLSVIVVGYGRIGKFVARKLAEHQVKFCIIESDNKKVEEGEKKGYEMVYGDVNENDLLLQLMSSSLELVLSTVENYDISTHVLDIVKDKHHHLEIRSIVTAQHMHEAESYYDHGADYVVFPHLQGAHDSRGVMEKHMWNPDDFIEHTLSHRKKLSDHKHYMHR